MKRHIIASLLLLIACGATACGAEPSDQAPTTGNEAPLLITNHTPTTVEGTFTDDTVALEFQSIEVAPNKVDVTVRADKTALVFRMDFAQGKGEFDAQSGQLTQQQIDAMPHVMSALAEALPEEEAMALQALAKTLNFLNVAPAATPLPAFNFVSENGWAYLSCNCGYQEAYGYRNWMGKGETCGTSASPHCPGRCGVGCGPDNLWVWWGSGRYTADCARHDYGVGSWGAASDDYMFAPANCW